MAKTDKDTLKKLFNLGDVITPVKWSKFINWLNDVIAVKKYEELEGDAPAGSVATVADNSMSGSILIEDIVPFLDSISGENQNPTLLNSVEIRNNLNGIFNPNTIFIIVFMGDDHETSYTFYYFDHRVEDFDIPEDIKSMLLYEGSDGAIPLLGFDYNDNIIFYEENIMKIRNNIKNAKGIYMYIGYEMIINENATEDEDPFHPVPFNEDTYKFLNLLFHITATTSDYCDLFIKADKWKHIVDDERLKSNIDKKYSINRTDDIPMNGISLLPSIPTFLDLYFDTILNYVEWEILITGYSNISALDNLTINLNNETHSIDHLFIKLAVEGNCYRINIKYFKEEDKLIVIAN